MADPVFTKKAFDLIKGGEPLPVIGNDYFKLPILHVSNDNNVFSSKATGRGIHYWDNFFLGLAKYVSTASKDPSTKVGAVIVDSDRRIISCGYNGFPKGVDDSPERYADRELKQKMVVHAETNAILFAERPLNNCVMYTYPFSSCSRCASMIINAGIIRCVAPPISKELEERWGSDIEISKKMFFEAGIQLDIVDFNE